LVLSSQISQSHVTIYGQSVNFSWRQAQFGAHDNILVSAKTVMVLGLRESSLRRRVCHEYYTLITFTDLHIYFTHSPSLVKKLIVKYTHEQNIFNSICMHIIW
jgi:hypothetical protein